MARGEIGTQKREVYHLRNFPFLFYGWSDFIYGCFRNQTLATLLMRVRMDLLYQILTEPFHEQPRQ